MSHQLDDFSKSLAEDSIARRQSLRLLGAAIAGMVFSPLATAWAAGADPCKAFCKCSGKKQQNACLSACRTCNGDTSRLSGSCGTYACCSTASCSGVCSDLKSDPNCGACGNDCRAFGETCCGSYCSDLENDSYNCGSCGNVCGGSTPYCNQGSCVAEDNCGGADLMWDSLNCGACGNVCPDNFGCAFGYCESTGGGYGY